MVWTISILALAIFLAVCVWFLQRFYAKATLETALVRTGFGGQKIVVDGGCISLPIVHQIQKIMMGTIVSRMDRVGTQPLLTGDRLPADMQMEFEFRVTPIKDGVATAAQSLGQRIARDGEAVSELLSGKFVDAMQNAAASQSLDEIHKDRAGFSALVADDVRPHLESLGLSLVSVSLIRVDQGTFSALDENNAFNAEGMRKLASLVAENRKERIRIEAEADIAIRESQLTQAQRRLDIERAEREAEIAQREHLARLEADAAALSVEKKANAARMAEAAELEKIRELQALKISHDESLRKLEMAAILEIEEEKILNSMRLSQKRVAESDAKVAEEQARSKVIVAAEAVQTQKERAAATREQEISLLKVQKENSVDAARISQEAESRLVTAQAAAKAEKLRVEAEAQGRVALIAAENGLSDAVIAMKLEQHKLDRLPEIMTQMMKPVEKIDSIRINQIGGLGTGQGATDGIDGAFGAAMDQILGMAVRLPAMKQMGAEIGLDFDANLAGRTADYANRIKEKSDNTTKSTGETK
ncbi:flotillin family protein [Rhodobacterales bacterium 56_14_T64]|nr:flotillin family protein [Rhodobacterales bacterium 56_14_T64]